jgi:hypothetical protein
MAKASKYNRARIRSRVRRPKRRGGSTMWTMVTVAVVVVGGLLVALSVIDNKATADVPPKIGDHWHAFLGVDVCGEWLPVSPEFHQRANESGIQAGLHSHGDGLMHLHPFASDEAGNEATVGRFVDYGGWSLSSGSMTLWDGITHENGQECGAGADAKPARLQWIVGEFGKPWPTKARTGNPADYRPKNGEIVAIYFLPEGDPLPEPPDAEDALANISDLDPTGGTGATGSTGAIGSTGTTGTSTP